MSKYSYDSETEILQVNSTTGITISSLRISPELGFEFIRILETVFSEGITVGHNKVLKKLDHLLKSLEE